MERATETRRDHTTDTRADCTVGTDGRITFTVPHPEPTARPRLLMRLRPKKGQPEKVLHTLDLEPAGDGRRHAVLEPLPVLAEGRWDLYLLSGPGAERQRLRPGLRDLRALVDGHLRDRPSPVAVRVPYATKDGYLAVRSWLRTAHAEVHGLQVTDGSTTVRARLHGASLTDTAVVRLRPRGGKGTALTAEVRADGDGRGFSFTVDHEQLTAGIWDLSVQPASDAPLIRIGRLLDDVADRKAVFVHPSARAGEVSVRPYYTVDNDLSVEVTALVG